MVSDVPPPNRWIPYLPQLRLLAQVTHWELLRRWSLSEVWRLTLASGGTAIAKWGRGSMRRELEVYHQLLAPLGIPRPTLYETATDSDTMVMLMEDLGARTADTSSIAEHILEAARELAVIRRRAQRNVTSIDPALRVRYTTTPETLLADLDHVEKALDETADQSSVLRSVRERLPEWLAHLYASAPITLVHNDYLPKNLMVVGGRIIPVDWSNASLGAHLGDLYCLAAEGKQHDIDSSRIVGAFQSVAAVPDIDWQLSVGGICWLLQGIRWVVGEGSEAVPSSREWIPDMLSDLSQCVIHASA